jgi:opacity protein-like surface antigen
MRLLLAVVLLVVSPLPARADFFVAPFAGMKFGGGTSIFDIEFAAGEKKFTIGAALMNVDEGFFGYEAAFGYIPGYFERDNRFWNPGSFAIDMSGSVLFTAPEGITGGGLRPYAAVGAGLTHVQAADKFAVLQVRRTVPIGTAGVGAIGLLTNDVGVRFDYRYLRSLTTDDGSLANVGRRISYSRFTVGLFLRL